MNRLAVCLSRGIARATDAALGPYQAAVIRIGFSATWLLFLLRELPHRREMYGPDGPWSWDLAQQLIASNHAFTVLMWSDSRVWFEIVYAVAVLSSALLLVGWRTRAMSVLFMMGVLSLQNRSVFMGDGGDNVIHLMSIYLVFTRCGLVWSLDERRARRSREARARGRLPARDRVGPALWAVLGLVLAVASGAGKIGGGLLGGWLTVFWGLWAAQALWWSVSRRAPRAESRTLFAESRALGDGSRALFDEPRTLRGEPRTLRDEPPTTLDVPRTSDDVPRTTLDVPRTTLDVPRTSSDVPRKLRDELRTLLDVVANGVHNAALLVIAAEACLIYSTAGWYKIQGSRWQDGTAVYYPLHLDYFSPWPALSGLMSSYGTVVMLVTYGTVAAQVAFPFTLLNRRVKNVLLAVMMTEHAVIAVVLGLPFFSLAMIAADSVFLPTSFLRWLGGRVARARERLFSRGDRAVPGPRPGTEEAAGQTHVGFTA